MHCCNRKSDTAFIGTRPNLIGDIVVFYLKVHKEIVLCVTVSRSSIRALLYVFVMTIFCSMIMP